MLLSRHLGYVAAIALALVARQALAADLPTSTPEAEGMSTEKLQEAGRIINGFIGNHKIAGGVVMIARHGKIVFFEPYGLMDLEKNRPMSRDTIFRIYSMSKAITSAAVHILRDEGKIDVNAPVSTYLPEFANLSVVDGDKVRPAERVMTVADLLRHTSGITYGNPGGSQVEKMFQTVDVLNIDSDLALMTKKLGQMPLEFEPGTDWHYGASIDVLGRIVEVVSGQSLDEFMSTRIFQPLGMTDTGFYVPAEKLDRFAANYYSDDKGQMIILDEPTKSRYSRKPGLLSGGGGLVGTPSDYMRFLLMIAGNGEFQGTRILSPESVQLMRTDQVPKLAGWVTFGEEVRVGVGYGLGFSVTAVPHPSNPGARQDEYGWGGAASTHYWLSPHDDLVVVTMEQRMSYSPQTEVQLKPIIYDAILK